MRRIGERVRAQAAHGLLGRNRELAQLLHSLSSDGPIVTWVHGLAGVGKSALLRGFLEQARAQGHRAILLESRELEPTPSGFLSKICPEASLESLAARLEDSQTVLLVIDSYRHLRLLDAWIRYDFLPAMPDNLRVVLAERTPPPLGWSSEPGWAGLFQSLAVGPLPASEALQLVTQWGHSGETARRIQRLARGNPLALQLAAEALKSRPDLPLEEVESRRVVARLAELYLGDLPAEVSLALEAASVVRRLTRTLLRSLTGSEAGYEQLLRLPFVEQAPDGLVLDSTVAEIARRRLQSIDREKYQSLLGAAWAYLRVQSPDSPSERLSGACWRRAADLLFLIDNPVVREAFFPSQLPSLSLQPAQAGDEAELLALARRVESECEVKLIANWQQRHPEAFTLVRDHQGKLVAFHMVIEADKAADLHDPVQARWNLHRKKHPVAAGESVLFCRFCVFDRSLSAAAECQAACWLDVKRVYFSLDRLRRLYTLFERDDPSTQAVLDLGFQVLDGYGDGSRDTLMNDFGPHWVMGWLEGLVDAGSGQQTEGLRLLPASRELQVDSRRTPLTPLEYAVLAYLMEHADQAVTRTELLEAAWDTSYTGGSNVVDSMVRSLRRKLESTEIVSNRWLESVISGERPDEGQEPLTLSPGSRLARRRLGTFQAHIPPRATAANTAQKTS